MKYVHSKMATALFSKITRVSPLGLCSLWLWLERPRNSSFKETQSLYALCQAWFLDERMIHGDFRHVDLLLEVDWTWSCFIESVTRKRRKYGGRVRRLSSRVLSPNIHEWFIKLFIKLWVQRVHYFLLYHLYLLSSFFILLFFTFVFVFYFLLNICIENIV